MKRITGTCLAVACLAAGTAIGYAAKDGGGVAVFKGKPARDGAYAALAEAERLAGNGSWELIGVGRVYYLSGDTTRGQAVFDRVLRGSAGRSPGTPARTGTTSAPPRGCSMLRRGSSSPIIEIG